MTAQYTMPSCPTPQCITRYHDETKNILIAKAELNAVDDDVMLHHIYTYIRIYLCETSSVVTTAVVDMTFFPAISAASQTLSAHKKTNYIISKNHKHDVVY